MNGCGAAASWLLPSEGNASLLYQERNFRHIWSLFWSTVLAVQAYRPRVQNYAKFACRIISRKSYFLAIKSVMRVQRYTHPYTFGFPVLELVNLRPEPGIQPLQEWR